MTMISNAVLASAVLAQCLVQSHAWVKGGSVCAEGETATLPITRLCDCGTNATSCSASYIESSITGIGLCPTKLYGDSGTCSVFNETISATKTAKSNQDQNGPGSGNTYAYLTQGVGMGEANSGAFVGSASYLVTAGTFSYNKNVFPKNTAAGNSESYSEICIVPDSTTTATSHTVCGPMRTATAGTFKFSLFAQTWGANFATAASSYANGYLIFRTMACYKGMTNLKINAVADGAGIVGTNTQVTSISGTQADGVVMTTTFPTDYMFGSTSDCTSDGSYKTKPKDLCVPAGSKTVSITAATASCGNGTLGFYLDYGFEIADISVKDKWVAYDPTVESGSTSGGSATISEARGQAKSSFFLLAALFAIASRA